MISTEFWRFQIVVEFCSFFKYSLLFIEVWNERCKCQHIQKESLLKLDLSPMIPCLILLLSYEGSISNPFQLRGNISAGLVVYSELLFCLVAETQNRVVEKVVVQFVHNTMSTLLFLLQANSFKYFWNYRCKVPLVFYHR
jgi:hypothetical protein